MKEFGHNMAKHFALELDFESFQSNDLQQFMNKIMGSPFDYLVINSGKWTHESEELADCLRQKAQPYIEVHLSNILAREEFRKKSYTAKNAIGVITGFKENSYKLALMEILLKAGAR